MLALVCLYLVLAPVWSPGLAPRIYDNARLLEFALLVPVAMATLVPSVSASLAAAWASLIPATRWLVAVFVAGGALAAALSSAPQVGALQVGLVALLLTLFLLVACAVRASSPASEQLISVAVFMGAALLVLKFWISFLMHFVEGRAFSWVSPFLTFANARFFGQYQAYVLLLLPTVALLLPLGRVARLSVALVGASVWSLHFMVGTRAVWVGFVVAMVAVLVFMRRGRAAWLLAQLGLALAGGAIYLAFATFVLPQPNATPIPPHNSVIQRNWESVNERKVMALAAIDLVREHPLTGVGPGQFGFHYYSTIAAHPHNTPLQLWSEYGLIAGSAGVALGVLLTVFSLGRISQTSKEAADPITACVAAALVMGLTDSLLSGNLAMPHSQVLCAVLAAWLVARSWRERPKPEMRPASPVRMTLAGGALLAAAVSAVLALEYLDVIRDMPSPPGIRAPNLWQYGRFDAW